MATSDGKKTGGREKGSKNDTSAGVVNRLIDNHYLHSNTSNFAKMANSKIRSDISNKLATQGLWDAVYRINNLISKMNDKANEFYQDIGLTCTDYFRPDNSGKNPTTPITYSPAGAREFSKKYLGLRKNRRDGEMTQKDKNLKMSGQAIIYQVINTPAAASAVTSFYENRKNQKLMHGNKKFGVDMNSAEVQRIINGIRELTGITLADQSGKIVYGQFVNTMNNLFPKKSKNAQGQVSYGFQSSLKGQEFLKALNPLLEVTKAKERLDDEIKSKNNQKFATYLRNTIENTLLNTNIFKLVGEDFFEWIKKEIRLRDDVDEKRYEKEFLPVFSEAKKKWFAEEFEKMVLDQKAVYFSDKDAGRGMTGFLGEISVVASINMFCEIGEELAIAIGQSYVKRQYQNVQYAKQLYDEQQGIYTRDEISTSRTFTGESASDVKIIGKSGKEYRIQIKNTFNTLKDNYNFHAIRLKSSVKLSTLIPTAFEEKDRDLLIYLLTNFIYLREHGREAYKVNKGPNGGVTIIPGKVDKFPASGGRYNISKILAYINLFLQLSYMFLLGVETKEVDEQNNAIIQDGNVGFIFNNTFIPITAFLLSSLELLKTILAGRDDLSGIGGTRNLSMKNLSGTTYVDSAEAQIQKGTLVNSGINGGLVDQKYPDILTAYGALNGDALYNDATINGIVFNVSIKKLEKLILRNFNGKMSTG